MQTKTKYVFSSLKGIRHRENRDNLLVVDELEYNIFAVFDGVSNAHNGKKASIKAKEFIKEKHAIYIREGVNISKLMFDLNQYLINSDLNEPYSTYCIVYYNKRTQLYCYSWLGDSRLYYITNQYVKQLTKDDSYSENIISKFLGDDTLLETDFRQLENIKDYGHLLLCTDGFYKIFESNKLEFFELFLEKSLSIIKNGLTSLIKGRNNDDSTFIFVK